MPHLPSSSFCCKINEKKTHSLLTASYHIDKKAAINWTICLCSFRANYQYHGKCWNALGRGSMVSSQLSNTYMQWQLAWHASAMNGTFHLFRHFLVFLCLDILSHTQHTVPFAIETSFHVFRLAGKILLHQNQCTLIGLFLASSSSLCMQQLHLSFFVFVHLRLVQRMN